MLTTVVYQLASLNYTKNKYFSAVFIFHFTKKNYSSPPAKIVSYKHVHAFAYIFTVLGFSVDGQTPAQNYAIYTKDSWVVESCTSNILPWCM